MGELLESLQNYADSDYLPMHMPGHKRRMHDMGTAGNPYFIDITEIEGFDDLHHAKGILQKAQQRAADLYHSEETHYLVNGSTAGILSAVSGCTDFGGKILAARNSHKSVYHAILLRGLQTEYLYPQSMGNMGINGAVFPETVENALNSHPDIQAVVITSPTYDGVVSDVRKISEIVHQKSIPLIVDEAHGAHFPFSTHFPEDSVSCKADVVIHSLHKTLPALTQTACIHLNGSLINREKIRRYLSVYQTSSPSYILMAALDECVEWITGHKDAFNLFFERLHKIRKELRNMKLLKLLDIPGMDESKILVSVKETALCGQELAGILREEFHVEVEMACGTYVCAITTVMDSEENLEYLKKAFLTIDGRLFEQRPEKTSSEQKRQSVTDEVLRTEPVCTLLEAEKEEQESVSLKKAAGRISGEFVTLYPPGIPLLVPGEMITPQIQERLEQYGKDGLEVQGICKDHIRVFKRRKTGSRWERYFV